MWVVDANLLPILVMVLLGDTGTYVEVSNGKEERGRGHESSLAGAGADDAGSKVGEPALHDWLREWGHGVRHVTLDDVGGIERTILSRSLVAAEFNPVHGFRWECWKVDTIVQREGTIGESTAAHFLTKLTHLWPTHRKTDSLSAQDAHSLKADM